MGERSDLQILLTSSREAACLSQSKAAAKARVSRKTWGNWEQGKSVPYKSTLPAIEHALGLDPGTLDDAREAAAAA